MQNQLIDEKILSLFFPKKQIIPSYPIELEKEKIQDLLQNHIIFWGGINLDLENILNEYPFLGKKKFISENLLKEKVLMAQWYIVPFINEKINTDYKYEKADYLSIILKELFYYLIFQDYTWKINKKRHYYKSKENVYILGLSEEIGITAIKMETSAAKFVPFEEAIYIKK